MAWAEELAQGLVNVENGASIFRVKSEYDYLPRNVVGSCETSDTPSFGWIYINHKRVHC